ncbi:MAG: dienelactone hydrolase family protein [Chloroflexi bacterium]|nr:dienelactone hydrolase family protein [Chloroflexota bacterium]
MTTQAPAPEGLIAEMVPFQGHNGDTIYGYLARPLGTGPYPGVVVIMEVYGLVEHIKEITRKMAAHGYNAVAPDLHFREGPGPAEEVAAKVREQGGVPDDRCIGDVDGAMRYLRALPTSNGKVGVHGYCSGGRQTYLVACNIPSVDAAVVCYGGGVVATPDRLSARQPVAPVDMTANLNCPMLGLFGVEDRNPSPEHVARMEEELKRHGKSYEFHTYADAGHGFFADYRPSYRQPAAVDGWEKLFGWYDRYLR